MKDRITIKNALGGSRSAAAFGAHLFTAVGAGLGLLALIAAADARFTLCFVLLGAALLVDGADGALARRLRVAIFAPRINGAVLDLVVDYLTYVVVPLFALWRSGLMNNVVALICIFIAAVASAIYFADERMKTDDLWFRGWPACWNIAVFYIFAFRFGAAVDAAILLFGSALMFAPVYGVHPLRVQLLRRVTLAMSTLWLVCAALVLWRGFAPYPGPDSGLALCAIYFIVLSLWRARAGGQGVR